MKDTTTADSIEHPIALTQEEKNRIRSYRMDSFLMYKHYRFTKDTDFKKKIKAKFQM